MGEYYASIRSRVWLTTYRCMRPLSRIRRAAAYRPPRWTTSSVGGETVVAVALVRDSARRAAPVVKGLHASHPRWLPDEASEGLDGRWH